MTTQDAMLAAIYAEPEADTPRLVYADLLDELGGASNTARAKFIRLQCDNAPLGTIRGDLNHAHANALREAHESEWAVCLCPAFSHSDSAQCDCCGDSRNLFRERTYDDWDEGRATGSFLLALNWERGFPYQVHCSLDMAFTLQRCCPECLGAPIPSDAPDHLRCKHCDSEPYRHRHVVSEWAKGVALGSAVTRLSPALEPIPYGVGKDQVWGFHPNRHALPEILLDELGLAADVVRCGQWRDFTSPKQASEAIARAIGNLARRAVREKSSHQL